MTGALTPPLPLKPKVFHLLLALGEGPQHGYGLKKAVLERTGGAVDLDPGGLYRLVSRLEAQGLVAESEAPEDESSRDQRRRYYALTASGEATLRAEARRLADLASWPEVRALARGGGGDA